MEATGFNLHQTIEVIIKAVKAVVCHMLFDFAVHGIVISLVLVIIAAYLSSQKNSFSVSILNVARRISIFCLLVAIPGAIALLIYHHLPDAGVFNFNSIGLLSFWSLICVHLVFEEINNSIVKKNQISELEIN